MNFSAALKLGRLPGAGSPIGRRLVKGGFWSLMGEAGSRALSFAAAVVVARFLGVAEFGAFALVQSTLAMLTTFAMFGMGHTSSRFIAAYRDADPARAESICGVSLRFAAVTGLLASAALFAAAPYIAGGALNAPELTGPLRLVAPVLFLYSVSSAMSGALSGFEAFSRLARVAWMTSLSNFLAVISGVSFWGLRGAVLAMVGSELIRCGLIMLIARKVMAENGMKLLSRPLSGDTKVLWQFSLPMFLTSALNAPVMWLCQAIIARQENGLAEVGLYNAAQKWMTIVILVPMAASAAFGPVLANLSGTANVAPHRRMTLNLVVVQTFLTAAPAALLAFASQWAVGIFGGEFETAAPVFITMMVLAPIFVLKHLYWLALTSQGHAWLSLALQALWAVVAITLIWAWQGGGAASLARSMLAAYGLALVASIMVQHWVWTDASNQRAG